MDISLNQITMLVADMDTSVRFYRDQLGLTPLEVSEYWSVFQAGPIRLNLHPGRTGNENGLEGGADAGTVNIVLEVPDLLDSIQTLREQGVAVDGPHLMEDLPPIAMFSDPDGISFTLAVDI